MKNVILLFLLTITLLSACKRDDIDVYNSINYVQFSASLLDSTTCSFLGHADLLQLKHPLVVEVVGFPATVDRTYKVRVVDTLSTTDADVFELPETLTIKAGKVVDTCWITFNKTAAIGVAPQRLVVGLEPTSDFELGQREYLYNIIYVTNAISKPAWWDSVSSSYLGAYSDKKFRLFIELTGVAELDPTDKVTVRSYAHKMKNYLLEQKDAGTPVLEDDGTEMTVNVKGR